MKKSYLYKRKKNKTIYIYKDYNGNFFYSLDELNPNELHDLITGQTNDYIGKVETRLEISRLLTPYANLFNCEGYKVYELQKFYNALCEELEEPESKCKLWRHH